MIDQNTRFLIVGLGLIGGSYAMGLKKKGYHVDAIDIQEEVFPMLYKTILLIMVLHMIQHLFNKQISSLVPYIQKLWLHGSKTIKSI